jgi:hypothetical protein
LAVCRQNRAADATAKEATAKEELEEKREGGENNEVGKRVAHCNNSIDMRVLEKLFEEKREQYSPEVEVEQTEEFQTVAIVEALVVVRCTPSGKVELQEIKHNRFQVLVRRLEVAFQG